MSYSISKLTTVAECDAVLEETQTKLSELNHQQYMLGHEQEAAAKGVTAIQVALIGVDAEIAGYQTKLDVLPASSSKLRKSNASKLRDAVNRRAQLTDRQEGKGSVALLLHELSLSRLQLQITEVTAFAAAVTAHKATL